MRGTNLTASLAALLILSSVGCKSMPSLAWWRTASHQEAADGPAVAHSAPALPSDVAIQTEGLATASSATPSPYVSTGAPVVNPAAFPSTGAPSFTPPDPTTTVAAAPPAENSSNLGSIAMPYNPNAAPPASQTTAAAAPPIPSADRYASTATHQPPAATPTAPAYPASNNNAQNSPLFGDVGSRYATQTGSTSASSIGSPANQPAPSATPSFAPVATTVATPPPITTPAAGATGNRYAQSTSPAAPPAVSHEPVQPAMQTVAAEEPYRPGGTSSYPGANPAESNYEVASRPNESNAPPQPETQVPNLGTPDNNPQPAPRYW